MCVPVSVSVCGCITCVCLLVCLFVPYYNVICVWRWVALSCFFCPQAIENVGNLQMGKWQQLMVPIKEMVDVLKVVREVSGIKRGSWVRIKRGMFKDDIARVSIWLSLYIRTYVCIFHTCVYTCMHNILCKYAHVHMRVPMCRHTHTHTHIHTHTHW